MKACNSSKEWKFDNVESVKWKMMPRNPSQVAGNGAQSLGEDPLAGPDVDELAERVVPQSDLLLHVELEGHDAVILGI